MIRSFGGEVCFADPTCNYEDDPLITHYVTDRPSVSYQYAHSSRCYVQPQWIFDSVNERMLLSTSEYSPDSILPPHLSPFVDDEKEGYVPLRREKLDRWKEQMESASSLLDEKNEENSTLVGNRFDNVMMEEGLQQSNSSEEGSFHFEVQDNLVSSSRNNKKENIQEEMNESTLPEAEFSKDSNRKKRSLVKAIENVQENQSNLDSVPPAYIMMSRRKRFSYQKAQAALKKKDSINRALIMKRKKIEEM